MNETLNCTEVNANTTECINAQQQARDDALLTALVTNLILLAVTTLVFLLFWMMKSCRRVYVARSDLPDPPHTIFGWLTASWKVSDREIEAKRGLDVLLYLKVLKYLWLICVGYLPMGLVLVLTHYFSGGSLIGTASISMSNVPLGSAFFAADIVAVFFNSVIALFFFYRLYLLYAKLRVRYRRTLTKPENFVVLVREFPKDLTAAQIRLKFEAVFPGKVTSVQKAYFTKGLDRHLKLREKMGLKLEEFNGILKKKNTRKTATDKPPFYCLCGNKRDGIELFEERFQEEAEICRIKQVKAEIEPKHAVGVAFVTFSDIQTAQAAAQSVFDEGQIRQPLDKSWVVDYAPAPESVEWNALRVTHMSRFVRSVIVNVAIFLLIFFWMIPVAFASSLVNLTTLATVLPFLVPILNLVPVVKGFIEGFLPGLVIIIFFAILVKFIITPLARAEGQYDVGIVNRSVFNKYFLFLLFNVFLGSVFAAGFFTVIGEVIENPASIPQLLAKALPGQVGYFISYVMILSLTGFGLGLIRPGPLILRFIFQRFLAKTKRKYRSFDGPFLETFHVQYARHCLVFCLVTCYSTMNPLIIVFGIIYFGLEYVASRYKLLYVYTWERPSEGSIFPSIWTRLCWILIVFQLTILAILAFGQFAPSAAIAGPLIITLLLWVWVDRQLHQKSKYGALSQFEPDPLFVELDQQDVDAHPHPDTYKFPLLREPLFQVEDQFSEQQYETVRWWPYEVVRNHGDLE